MKNKHFFYAGISILFIFLLLGATELAAQCPMCKMAVESNYKNGGTAGSKLNMGILFMLTMPYLMIGTLAFLWIRGRRAKILEKTQKQIKIEDL